MATPVVRVVGEPYSPEAFVAELTGGTDAGAVVTFTGLCRSEDGALAALELEHYPGMAERRIREIAGEGVKRFALLAHGVVHRHGLVHVGEPIVTVVSAARHRQAAFDGAMHLMDFLKTDAPFWKKEHAVDGTARGWVSAADRDDEARRRWRNP